jgi:glucosylceramidase
MLRKYFTIPLLIYVIGFSGQCNKKNSNNSSNSNGGGGNTATGPDAEFWLTTSDANTLLAKQAGTFSFGTVIGSDPVVNVDSTTTMQTVDGFGYTLTGGSAYLINKMDAGPKAALLNELFGNGANSIGVSYLRLSIGASDLNQTVFSYDDMPMGQTDPTLANFTLSQDTIDLVPVLKQIIAINPNIKLLGSPWSPPVWMKDNGNTMGGGLQMQYYAAYSQYFVKYIQAMKAKGITIDAITIQNEPQYGGNNPSMVMSAAQEAEFIKTNLGPAFQTAGITTKIIVWDHNCDNPNYPITILNDAAARQYVNGSAFHLYGGDISALSTVHTAYPDKQLYFTEEWTGANATFADDLKWHLQNVVIGSMRNWSKVALEWNLASDPSYNPHTPGGCTECKGAVTINGSNVARNVGYYNIAHASKFIPAGSIRINSNNVGAVTTAAFKTPAGKKVLLAVNTGGGTFPFIIKFNGKGLSTSLPPGAVGTYVW